jgi:multicomponent Na+:H+ antiporter subunit E
MRAWLPTGRGPLVPALRPQTPDTPAKDQPCASDPGRSQAKRDGAVHTRARLSSALVAGAALAGLWLLLNPGDHASWVIGAPAVLAGVAVALLIPAGPRHVPSLSGALRFAVYFARATVIGSVDVARRALRPRMALSPGFFVYATRLPPGAPMILFTNVLSLLPGTLAADLRDGSVVVHCIDVTQDIGADLTELEERIGDLFRLDLAAREARR